VLSYPSREQRCTRWEAYPRVLPFGEGGELRGWKSRIRETAHRNSAQAGKERTFPKNAGAAGRAEVDSPLVPRVARTLESLKCPGHHFYAIFSEICTHAKDVASSLLTLGTAAGGYH